MSFEDVLQEVGGFSWYQFLVLSLLWLPRMIVPLQFMLHNFISAVPPHSCVIPLIHTSDNYTLAQGTLQDQQTALNSCSLFVPTVGNSSYTSAVIPCSHGWVYDRSQFSSTTATEALATFFFVGVTIGAVLFGSLSDKFGRKPILLVSYVSTAMLATLSAFSTSYMMFAVTRTLTGMAIMGMVISTVCLNIEWTDIAHRTFIGTVVTLGWSVGNMLLALLAYLIRDWRPLMLAATSPCLAAIISWWWIPESSRWLLVSGRVEESQSYLISCARMNKKEVHSAKLNIEALKNIATSEDSNNSYTYLDLVKTPKMRKLSFCSGFFWFAVAFTYYGISYRLTGFGLNIYLAHFMFTTIEFPVKLGMYFVLDRIGRRNSQAWTLIITGIMIVITALIPTEYGLARPLVAVMGKGFCEAAFTVAYLYTPELFPTVLRQGGLGYTSFLCRLGSSLAPMAILLDDIWSLAAVLVFASVAIVGGCVVFLLPDTLNVDLPETIQDVEERHKNVTVEHQCTRLQLDDVSVRL